MSPKELVQQWVRNFNEANIDARVALYAANATNHQVVTEPLVGKETIRSMFETELNRAEMTCIVENLFEVEDWAILEWSDPNGLRGCGFVQVQDGQIVLQRGYFDQLSFFRLQGIAPPETYLAS